jgi:hypothetical protein
MRSENFVSEYAFTFAPGLTDPATVAPQDVVARHGKGVIKRYNVYRNNVTVSLIDALAAIYPAVQRITGADFFKAMARFHVRETPPTSALLFEYGRHFPAFIESYEYAREMPWLADTARIERAWLDAYHAADRVTLSAEALACIDPALLADVRFEAHPATRIVRSAYPAVAIFAMKPYRWSRVPALCERSRRCTRHAPGSGCDRLAPSGGRRGLPQPSSRWRVTRRRDRRRIRRSPCLRYPRQSGRNDLGRRVHRRSTWRQTRCLTDKM